MSAVLVDSHCHIPMIEGEGSIDEIINAALDNDVGHMLCVCVELEDYPLLLQLASEYACISASVGVHPNTQCAHEPGVDELVALAAKPAVVAIGETGLDYFRSQGQLDWQRDRFRTHIRAARKIKKPLIIHSREAKDDVIRILREEGAEEVGGVMHCFVDDWPTAEAAMELGFYISFSGIVTFKNAKDLQAVAKQVPLESLLVETDSPYLAPVPHRGKTNQPAYVRHVAEYIAELKGSSYEAVAKASSDNFFSLFKTALS